MSDSFVTASLERVMSWARANSLWYTAMNGSCCGNEWLNTTGCRYDIERFGCLSQKDPRQCDLLIICGTISTKMAPELKALYDAMPSPKFVMAVGSCANCGGPFSPEISYSTIPGAGKIIPVDIFVPGCPPRPEAIMNGLIALQDKMRG